MRPAGGSSRTCGNRLLLLRRIKVVRGSGRAGPGQRRRAANRRRRRECRLAGHDRRRALKARSGSGSCVVFFSSGSCRRGLFSGVMGVVVPWTNAASKKADSAIACGAKVKHRNAGRSASSTTSSGPLLSSCEIRKLTPSTRRWSKSSGRSNSALIPVLSFMTARRPSHAVYGGSREPAGVC